MRSPDNRFLGKFAGFVRDVGDPDSRGRLRAYVPEVMGSIDDSDHWIDWALPCFPWFAHNGVGGALVPQVDSGWGVWIEFRQGDARFPIWTGVFPVGSTQVDATKIQLDSPNIHLGGACITAPGPTSEAIVVGGGIDTFTGTPYSNLGSASTRVFVKKS